MKNKSDKLSIPNTLLMEEIETLIIFSQLELKTTDGITSNVKTEDCDFYKYFLEIGR